MPESLARPTTYDPATDATVEKWNYSICIILLHT